MDDFPKIGRSSVVPNLQAVIHWIANIDWRIPHLIVDASPNPVFVTELASCPPMSTWVHVVGAIAISASLFLVGNLFFAET